MPEGSWGRPDKMVQTIHAAEPAPERGAAAARHARVRFEVRSLLLTQPGAPMRLILSAQKIQIPLNQLANTSFYTMPPASTHLAAVSCEPFGCSWIPRGPETIPPCPQYPLQWPD